jgi:membrane protein DedA with SNARE-associated domain
MDYLLSVVAHHGYLVIFLFVFAEALGFPLPASLALIAGGAAAASGILRPALGFATAISALLLGDSMFYLLGRYTGWGLLGFLCKVSMNPETCILKSAEMFHKRGKATIVVAKFIPGINAMAAPLAGSMRMRFGQFLLLDIAGASLYTISFGALGYLFDDFITVIAHTIRAAADMALLTAVIVCAMYAGYRVWVYRKGRIYDAVPRIEVKELVRKLAADDGGNILIVDVRSKGYYDRNSLRIKGSVRIEPHNLSEEIKGLSRSKGIYLYCT